MNFGAYDLGGMTVRNENVSYFSKHPMLQPVSDEQGKYMDRTLIYDTTCTFSERVE